MSKNHPTFWLDSSKFYTALSDYVRSSKDVTIRVNDSDKTIKANSFVLSMSSDFLKNLLRASSDGGKDIIILKDVSGIQNLN